MTLISSAKLECVTNYIWCFFKIKPRTKFMFIYNYNQLKLIDQVIYPFITTEPYSFTAIWQVDRKMPWGRKPQSCSKDFSAVWLYTIPSCSVNPTITVHATQLDPPLTPFNSFLFWKKADDDEINVKHNIKHKFFIFSLYLNPAIKFSL